MSIERVRAYLAQFGAEGRIREFDQSSATVELAARAVGTEPARIAKTLSFMVGDTPTLVVLAGDARVNNAAFKATFHTKAKMLSADQAAELVGHAVGGVCPFGVNDGVEVWLDESLRRFETVWPAAGSSNSAIELTLDELERFSRARGWVDVGRGWCAEE
ncbi:YbaK/EbsC family protein [Olsenella profusa]|uniref:YbaK/EbsC family protein n=1 Tax=Olsenella profusa TaxID=138595 RepID=A0ABS2F2T2_9ACTN|nr:YbaK/EbsC family protein [Olsenella profusa]MBM6774859.1 YbaK/EbsC family protein [Olsenella profusa]